MNTGMLWFDNDPKADIVKKIQRAADYYQHKYGCNPDLCYVHPSMIGKDKVKAGSIIVRPNRSILPHHFWIGSTRGSLLSNH